MPGKEVHIPTTPVEVFAQAIVISNWSSSCGNCGGDASTDDRYCGSCGKVFKWMLSAKIDAEGHAATQTRLTALFPRFPFAGFGTGSVRSEDYVYELAPQ
jgi:predicted amidophosphoribosyltransferase